ncbi:hypothetical protein HanPI659440_Chr05g0199991 [Helianthus annuus]|nr:hypothetical protein HanPI659440_Chr05g0199991 [Helianthus annuus]
MKSRIEDPQISLFMHYVLKSAKSATNVGLDDIDSILSPRSAKKEPSKSLSFQVPRAVTTTAKAGSKRKKPAEPENDSFEVERQLHDSLTEGFAGVKAHYEKKMAELEENLARMRSIVAVKDKALSKLEKDKKGFEEQLLFSEVGL